MLSLYHFPPPIWSPCLCVMNIESISSSFTPSFFMLLSRGDGCFSCGFSARSNSIVVSSVLIRYETPVSVSRSLSDVCQSINGSISSFFVVPMFFFVILVFW